MRRLTFDEVEQARTAPGTTALLFITDRCPVGCAHCSVDSRPDSPRIRDFELFEAVVEALCAGPYPLIGISGGEPFVERRGLALAVDRLHAAGKQVIVYTSGFWARGDASPAWIHQVIRKCSAVFLSTDAFHQAVLAEERFVHAARLVAAENVWIIVQVLDDDAMHARAGDLLGRALGESWREFAEVHRIPPLPYGRGAAVFTPGHRIRGAEFGPCRLVHAPVVRYDGLMSVCCNEAVIMGSGPDSLRRRGTNRDEILEALGSLAGDEFFRAIGAVGPGTMSAHPRLADLGEQRHSSICQICWRMAERVDGQADTAFFTAAALLGGRGRR